MIDESEAPRHQPRNADPSKWCEYHRSTGHDTNSCWTLKREIDNLIKAGHYRRYDQRDDRQQGPVKDQKKETQAVAKRGVEGTFSQELGPAAGTINTIAGGFAGGKDTQVTRKRHVRVVNSVHEIPFGFQHPDITISMADFEGIKPHKDDPIVVQLKVNSFNVIRLLLDQGSSANIIYGDAFDKLGLTNSDLTPYTGALVGFSGEQVWVRGYLDLDTIFGEEENVRVLRVRYLVL